MQILTLLQISSEFPTILKTIIETANVTKKNSETKIPKKPNFIQISTKNLI